MNAVISKLTERYYLTGVLLILFSLIIFLVPEFTGATEDQYSGLFLLNYALAVFYFLTLLLSRKRRTGQSAPYIHLFLILFLVSAYALNREMTIFQSSVNWLSILVVVSCVNLASFNFSEFLPPVFKLFQLVLLGISTLLFLYMSLYLIPSYGIGIAGFLFLGISLHCFVPLLIVIYSIRQFLAVYHKSSIIPYAFGSGIALAIIASTVFSIQWKNKVSAINSQYQSALVNDNLGLPAWINVAKFAEADLLTERILKADIVYTVSNIRNFRLFSFPGVNFNEPKFHDPLVVIATFFGDVPDMPTEERIKILEILFDARHSTEERLWSGENLSTTQINTSVRLWPAMALAYTEKLVTVRNAATRKSWGSEEEAIYTFQLPEGGVITSLSLWINGVEEKGILTSQGKAQEAYATIVGKEARDPSLVHWKEGNRITVRVFPVLPSETRIFKIGISSPVPVKDGYQVYQNIQFKGPRFHAANEAVSIQVSEPTTSLYTPASFRKHNQHYTKEGSYQPNWNFRIPFESLQAASFSFNNSIYTISPYKPAYTSISLSDIYLDVNSSWTRHEFDSVLRQCKNRRVYVHDQVLNRVSAENSDQLFRSLSKQHLSLFPLQELAHNPRALLITKSSGPSPDIQDLKNTQFYQTYATASEGGSRIKVFAINGALSSYHKTLKEFRAFDYDEGDLDKLAQLLQNDCFVANPENDNKVLIHSSQMLLRKDEGALPSSGPDHLMRLYAYNHIMSTLGQSLITGNDSTLQSRAVDEARAANIVTPVSSLIVLESQKDYDRFDIKADLSGLQNASLKSKGAVPEPHEWALIIIAVIVLLYAKYFNVKTKSIAG